MSKTVKRVTIAFAFRDGCSIYTTSITVNSAMQNGADGTSSIKAADGLESH